MDNLESSDSGVGLIMKSHAGRPRFTISDVPDCNGRDREQRPYHRWRMAKRNETANGSDLLAGKLGRTGLLSVIRENELVNVGVAHVLTTCTPLKVFWSVVCLYPVLMVNLVSFWVGILFKKRLCDHSSHRNMAITAFPANICGDVSVFIDPKLDYSISPNRLGGSPYSSKIGYGIFRKLGDCFPSLYRAIGRIRHFQPFDLRLLLFRCGIRRQPFLAPSLLVLAITASSLFEAQAAVPSYTAFRGTGGIIIVSNPPTGTIVIDGSAIAGPTNGVSASMATNIAEYYSTNTTGRPAQPISSVQFNSNGVMQGSSGFVFTNGLVAIGTNTPSATFHVRSLSSGTSYMRVDDTNGTPRFRVGVYDGAPQFGGVWFGNITPTIANYSVASDGLTTILNAAIGNIITFAIGGGAKWNINASGHLITDADNTYDFGASGANRPRNLFVAGVGEFGSSINVAGSSLAANNLFLSTSGYLIGSGDGIWRFSNLADLDFNRIQFGGTDAGFPSLGKTNGHLKVLAADGHGSSATNALWFQGQNHYTAATNLINSQQSGKVKIAQGHVFYYVTNSLVTTNSIVVGTMNTFPDAERLLSIVPMAGLLRIDLSGAASPSAGIDVSWFIVAP